MLYGSEVLIIAEEIMSTRVGEDWLIVVFIAVDHSFVLHV